MLDITPKTLGQRIKFLRIERGLTQGALTRGEITAGMISQIESDRITPSVRVISLIAQQLGVSPSELVNEVESRTSQIQMITDARDFLLHGDGKSAIPLLKELLTMTITYLSSQEIELDIAYAVELTGDINQAKELYENLEHKALFQHNHLLLAKVLQRRGDLARKQDRKSLALYCFKKSLRFLAAVYMVDPLLVIYAKKQISILSYYLRNLTQSLHYAQEVYCYYQQEGMMDDLAQICHTLSVLHGETGNHIEAISFAQDTVSIYRSLGMHREMIDAMFNQAIVLRIAKKWQIALNLLTQVIAEYRKEGDTVSLVSAWIEQAHSELLVGNHEKSMQIILQSMEWIVNGTIQYAEAQRIRALLLIELDQRRQAITVLQECLTTFLSYKLFVTAEQVLSQLEQLYDLEQQEELSYECHERKYTLMANSHQQLTASYLSV